MAGYNSTSLALAGEQAEKDCFEEVEAYLSAEGGYWLKHDVWTADSGKFTERGIDLGSKKKGAVADFSMIPDGRIKMELKYHALWSFSMKKIAPSTYAMNYKSAVRDLGGLLRARGNIGSVMAVQIAEDEPGTEGWADFRRNAVLYVVNQAKALLADIYDVRDESEKDVWRALRIPGARLSAVQKRSKLTLCFSEIPDYYRETVKRYFRRLVVKRSWSHCSEMLRYIKVFFKLFYKNSYGDGFLKSINRFDIERYLEWVAEEYEGDNATYVSKAVSFIREFLDYIQMAEYPEAPDKDVYRLIFDDDIPRRERPEDTYEKIKYIPEPIRNQLDANVSSIEPSEMQPLYVLLRESGWRGTDILDLRYDTCLDYIWNKTEGKYIPYFLRPLLSSIPPASLPHHRG